MCASTILKEIVSAITILVEAAVMFVVAILVSEAPVVITRLLDNGNVCRQVNQVKLCGTVCVKKLLPLDEFQCARCIMLIMKVEIVVGGEDYSKPKHKRRSFTQHLFFYAHHPLLVCLCHWT